MSSAIWSSAGILVLMLSGWWIARLLAQWRYWWAGLIPPGLVIGMLIAERWQPGWLSMGWMISGRREFVFLALMIPLLLVTLGRHLPVERQRRLVNLLTALLTVHVSLFPFLAPAFEYTRQSNFETFVDLDGICLQSTGYNCGPAAAVTVLRSMGFPAEEGELAISAYTTRFSGTPTDCLMNAIDELYGAECQIEHSANLDDLKAHVPCIAVVKYSLMVDHYVAVIAVSDSHVQLGDPLKGLKLLTHDQFNQKWRRQSILFKR